MREFVALCTQLKVLAKT